MRTIKFKGYSNDHDSFIYGDFAQYPDGTAYITEHSDVVSLSYEVDPSTICQYIGIVDRAGREIYEGDLVESKNAYDEVEMTCKVVWSEESLCYLLESVYGRYTLPASCIREKEYFNFTLCK